VRIASVVLVTLVALPVATADTHVALVVDASVDMWRPMNDGVERFVAVRNAITSLAVSQSDDTQTRLTLWLIGGGNPEADVGCVDVTLAAPPGDHNHVEIADRLAEKSPSGKRPVIAGVVAAGTDLLARSGRHRMVLIVSGEDTCLGNRRAAARTLGRGIELRVVGLALDEETETSFAAVAPTRNPADSRELLRDLRWAAYEGREPSTRRQPVLVEVVQDGGLVIDDLGLQLIHSVTRERFDFERNEQRFEATVSPGLYGIEVSTTDSVYEYAGLTVTPGPAATTKLAIPTDQPATPTVDGDGFTAGDSIPIRLWGAPTGRHWVTAGAAGAPLDGWTARAATADSNEVELALPLRPGPVEIRFAQRLPDGLIRASGGAQLTTRAAKATLEPVEPVEVSTWLAITWQGPDQPGDHIMISPKGKDRGELAACRYTVSGNPLMVRAPESDGTYHIRYVSGLTGRTLARTDVEVAPEPIEIAAPDRVDAGRTFIVSWSGPAAGDDYLVIAREDIPHPAYLFLRPASPEGSTEFIAPRTPGGYEIRFVRGVDNLVLGSLSIDVVEVPASLQAPRRVRAGTRFELVWTGPDGPGDFVAVAKPGSAARRYYDFAYTASGNPANIAAPFEPGSYVVRYLTRELTILAHENLIVE
jgi:Ca-activated chloride channel family protein